MATLDYLNQALEEVAVKARHSPTFRSRLLSLPTTVLNEHGAGLPPDLHTRVVEPGELPAGGWEIHRHGDKTTLVVSLPAASG